MKIKKIEQKVEKARKELEQEGTKPEIIEYLLDIYRENLYDEYEEEETK